MLKLYVHPEYVGIRDFLRSLPLTFDQYGEVLYARRNVIRRITAPDGTELNVKRYGVPGWFNRVVYTYLRSSKGWRAYTYPARLLRAGIDTPRPVAYIEQRRGGLIRDSYLVTLQCPYRRNFYEFGNARVADCRDVVAAFARFTARQHEAGILHLDYSPGNILFDRVGEEWRFSLIDINRMRFGPVSIKRGCANFARLWGQKAFFEQLAADYAAARGGNAAQCRRWIMFYRRRFWQRYRRRHELKFNLEL